MLGAPCACACFSFPPFPHILLLSKSTPNCDIAEQLPVVFYVSLLFNARFSSSSLGPFRGHSSDRTYQPPFFFSLFIVMMVALPDLLCVCSLRRNMNCSTRTCLLYPSPLCVFGRETPPQLASKWYTQNKHKTSKTDRRRKVPLTSRQGTNKMI